MQTSIHIDGRPPTPPAEEVVGILLKGDKNTSPARAGNKRVTFGFDAPVHISRELRHSQNDTKNKKNDSTSTRRGEVLVPAPRPKGAGRVSWDIALPVSPLAADVALDCTPPPSPPTSTILASATAPGNVDLSTAMPGDYPTSITSRSFTAIFLAVFTPYLAIARARLSKVATFAQSIFTFINALTAHLPTLLILLYTYLAIISESHLSLATRALIALFGLGFAVGMKDYLPREGDDEDEAEMRVRVRMMKVQRRLGVEPRVWVGAREGESGGGWRKLGEVIREKDGMGV